MSGKAKDATGDVFGDSPVATAQPARQGRKRSNADEVLLGYIERLERLNEEAAEISEAKSDLMKEAKSNGFTPAQIRRVVALRKLDAEQRAVLQTYIEAAGVFA